MSSALLWRVGHRGAPSDLPANTLKSFQRAFERGCNMVECDVRYSLDGALVLAHDEEVMDVRGYTYVIEEVREAKLRALDLGAGEGVPTLQALVEWAQGRCAIMADMKREGDEIEERVAKALAPLPDSEKVVSGSCRESRTYFHQYDANFPLSFSLNRYDVGAAEDFLKYDYLRDTQTVTWEHPLLTEERVSRLHEIGVRVFAWTVDDVETMQRLISYGVDGIISNRAERFAQLL
jgi:glycerophosphoryl diester phosphodiesterase